MSHFSLSTKGKIPVLPYEKIKNEILGKGYTLTLAFVGEKTALALNKKYRKKTYIPNVLSFPLEKKVGEIYICPAVAKKEYQKFNMSWDGYIGYLFIHALLHLKGHDHGATMEKAEKKYCSRYSLK